MANPVDFEESNFVFNKPDSMSDEECVSLHVHRDKEQSISCWELTPLELEEVAATGKVYLSIFGPGHPPVAVMGTSPFEEQTEEVKDVNKH